MDTKPILVIENDDCIANIKQIGIIWVDKALEGELTFTKPGSISHLLYGEKPSEQSINIKLGRLGEYLSKELIIPFNQYFAIDVFITHVLPIRGTQFHVEKAEWFLSRCIV